MDVTLTRPDPTCLLMQDTQPYFQEVLITRHAVKLCNLNKLYDWIYRLITDRVYDIMLSCEFCLKNWFINGQGGNKGVCSTHRRGTYCLLTCPLRGISAVDRPGSFSVCVCRSYMYSWQGRCNRLDLQRNTKPCSTIGPISHLSPCERK